MASKLQTIIDYAQKLTSDLSERRGVWQRFLTTAARVYKYSFPDQLLIYGQRPDATACALFEFWNERMGHRVNKGAKGIALIDGKGERPRLKYVFDVSDTHPFNARSPEVRLWRMESKYQDAVTEALSNAFGSSDEAASFDEHLIAVSRIAAQDNMADYLDELRTVRTGSFLEEFDDLNLETRFRKLLGDSVAFTVLTRCGIDAYQHFDSEDFDTVFEFHTFDTMTVLGTATSDVSRMLLLEIERTITKAVASPAAAFALSQEEIDYILTRGSHYTNGKYRIYEQFLKNEGSAENVKFLKDEYGIGGRSNAVPNKGYFEMHDGKGITVSAGYGVGDGKFVLPWNKVEKRIGELIAADRYLSRAEKEAYPAYQRDEETRAARMKLSEEFRAIIGEYKEFVKQIGESDKLPDRWYLVSCATAFSAGEKKMFARIAGGDFILPIMRDAMQTIIADNTPLTERCEAMLTALDGDIAKPMEPTEEELNPPPPPKKEYRFALGDTVHLGTQEYEILAFDEQEVRLYDTEFPLFNKTMPRAEFDRKLADNPQNDHLLVEVEEQPAPAPQPTAEPPKRPGQTRMERNYRTFARQFPEIVSGEYRYLKLESGEGSGMMPLTIQRIGENEIAVAHTYEQNGDLMYDPEMTFRIDAAKGTLEPLTFRQDGMPQIYQEVYPKPGVWIPKLQKDLSAFTEQWLKNIEAQGRVRTRAIAEIDGEDVEVSFDADGHPIREEEATPPAPVDRGDEMLQQALLAAELSERTGQDVFAFEEGNPLPINVPNLAQPAEKEKTLAPPAPKPRGKTPPFMLHPEIPPAQRHEYRITDDQLGVGTPSERYARNVAAIHILKLIESEDRLATPVEQEVLAQYVGWGGLADCFDDRNNHYAELKALLTDEEYAAARESTLTAFYTPPIVIRAVYKALDNMGFTS